MDEARRRTAEAGFADDRPDVMQHWAAAHTWIRAPIALAGEVLRSHLAYELVVGFTRLGNLLGALDRPELRSRAGIASGSGAPNDRSPRVSSPSSRRSL